MDMPKMTAEESALFADIQAAILDLVEIGKAMGTQDGLEQRHVAAFDRVEELGQRIPSPARSQTDFILRAQVAWALADKDDGVLRDLAEPGAKGAAAQAIMAVLEFAGIRY